MPLYEFSCGRCGPFTAMRTVDGRDHPEPCPKCGAEARRCLSVPRLMLLSADVRKAHAVNERSAHEPRVRRGHQCGSGCGCAPGGRGKAAGRGATDGGSAAGKRLKGPRRNNRPWMLGH